MHQTRPNVLPLHDPPRQKSYRAAVAKVIRTLKAERNLTNVALAEEIGCSDETVSNAENECTDLSAVTLLRIGYAYGRETIQPVIDLCDHEYREPPSIGERIHALEKQLAEIRQEVGA